MGEMIEKKRKASNATEATMPMVVNTAIVEQPMQQPFDDALDAIARAQLAA